MRRPLRRQPLQGQRSRRATDEGSRGHLELEPQRHEGHGATYDWCASARPNDPVLTVTLSGELDLAAVERIWPDLDGTSLKAERAIVVLDLSGVTFIDSTGLKLLLRIKRRVNADARLLLSRPSKVVVDLLELTKLTEHFEYLDRQNGYPTA